MSRVCSDAISGIIDELKRLTGLLLLNGRPNLLC
jgi:hypothetical protein